MKLKEKPGILQVYSAVIYIVKDFLYSAALFSYDTVIPGVSRCNLVLHFAA